MIELPVGTVFIDKYNTPNIRLTVGVPAVPEAKCSGCEYEGSSACLGEMRVIREGYGDHAVFCFAESRTDGLNTICVESTQKGN